MLARVNNNKDFSPNNYKLAYRFTIMGIEPYYSSHAVYVDATAGDVFKKQNLLQDYHCNCCNGTAQTLYNGQQTIVTRHRGFPIFNYLLKDNCRGDGIQTYLAGDNLTDSDNDWSVIDERPATSAHWAAGMTYDFYNNTYGRNSFDGNGKMIEVYTVETFGSGTLCNTTVSKLNAQWDPQGQRLRFGNGESGIANALVSLDVVGHEFTHAVTDNEAALDYSNESGALNESFSDIFGAMVEFYVEGNGGNYFIGEDYWIQDGYLRNMQNPNAKTQTAQNSNCANGTISYAQPDTYNGNNWVDFTNFPNCDRGGVHINSGVQNFWFFLLSEGGTGTNDNGDAYNVMGIGRNKAAAISYRNLSVYLTSSSDYSDAKNGAIFSAMDLYGTCANEVLQTVNAWNAVGVSSANGFGVDIAVNCAELNVFHNGLPPFIPAQPYTVRAIGNLTANCAITANGQPVTFIAGQSITLTNGFESGDNFHAFIDPCLSASFKMANSNNNENSNTGNNEHIENDEGNATLIDNTISKKFSVYPNPSQGKFILDIPTRESKESISIHIHDILGNIMYEKSNVQSGTINIDLYLSKGIYFINVIQNNKIYTERIILQ